MTAFELGERNGENGRSKEFLTVLLHRIIVLVLPLLSCCTYQLGNQTVAALAHESPHQMQLVDRSAKSC